MIVSELFLLLDLAIIFLCLMVVSVSGLCVLVDGVSAGSICVKSVFDSVLGCIESLFFVVVSSLNVCVMVSCFDLLCSCVTYCNNLGLI